MRDLEQVLNQVVEAAVQVTGAEESSLLLVDKSTGQLYMSAAWNIDSKTVHTLRLKVEDSLAGTVVKTGEPIIVSGEDLIKIKTAYMVKCLVYVPLRIHHQVIGVLSVDNRTKPHEFDQHEVQILSVLADFAAIPTEKARPCPQTIQHAKQLDA